MSFLDPYHWSDESHVLQDWEERFEEQCFFTPDPNFYFSRVTCAFHEIFHLENGSVYANERCSTKKAVLLEVNGTLKGSKNESSFLFWCPKKLLRRGQGDFLIHEEFDIKKAIEQYDKQKI